MYRTHSKYLAIAFLLYALGIAAVAHAGAAPVSSDGSRLAHAYHDVLAAEQALRANPEAAASFGPMLREARARLEAGLAAAAETGAGEEPVRAFDASNTSAAHDSRGLRPVCTDCPAGHPTRSTAPASNAGLQLRRQARNGRLIWA